MPDDRRERLEALRDLLTEKVAVAEVQYVAPLARQLQAVIGELSKIEPEVKVVSASDDLKSRREARRSTAKAGTAPATGTDKRGKRSG